MENIITVADCLKYMETGAVFSAKWVTFDKKRRTGGDFSEVLEASLLKRENPEKSGSTPRARTAREQSLDEATRRPANHSEHYTRNIQLHTAGQATEIIKKLHPPLLVEFNGKIVVP
jgi:hypothetical protein